MANEKLKGLLMIEDIDPIDFIEEDDNPPVFYDPNQVIKLSLRLKQFAVVAIVIGIVISLPQIGQMQRIIFSFFGDQSNYQFLSWLITSIVGVIAILVQSFIYYFTFRAISWILLVLMEMEFGSRKRTN